ncbi:hypothetical protein ALO76_00145 [Pseudomonas syringae pv. coriandricola]|nr:hypothetical protein ALO76_00145 [Pseudomonas syringae pv. coriandricola]
MAALKTSVLNYGQFQQLKKQESIAKPGFVDMPKCVLAGPCSIQKN